MTWKLAVFATAFALGLAAQGDQNPEIVDVSLQKSFIPIGFDDNDRVQVTVEGMFPNTCYKVSTTGASVNEEQKTIQFRQTAYHYSGVCLQMIVPFTQVVDVGLVKAGEYDLYDGTSGIWLGKLPVNRATHPEADDFLYAPVTDAFLTVDASATKTLTLVGAFSDRCTVLSDVKVSYFPEVIVVQPVAKRLGERCEPGTIRFTKTIELDASLKGTYLLHVRAMNGQAINKIVEAQFIE